MEEQTYKVNLQSLNTIYRINKKSKVKYWFWGIVISLFIFLFLPWTQNIICKGSITTLRQEQRPQKINSPIPGRIVKWYVKEGDVVQKGDTLLKIAEIKEDYLDPDLINKTQQQVRAKKGSIDFYKGKISTSGTQINALLQAKQLKIEQLNNKLKQLNNKLLIEQAELTAVENELGLLKDQYERQQKMYTEGLVSQTQLQQRNAIYQNAISKKISADNKLLQTQQEIANTFIEKNSVEQEYIEKINKAEGDRFQSLSQVANTEADIAKLENQVTNYTIRNGMYIITAPQNGQIVQASKAGIGEIVKDGEPITLIVPDKPDYAVEMFVRPIDLPLINIGQAVSFMFDGFPAIVFSGWPNSSYGTYTGKIVAFENTINSNGMFRVLVAADNNKKQWPSQLKMGCGAQGIALLKNVPVWYELWRNINGFPPDYYLPQTLPNNKKDK